MSSWLLFSIFVCQINLAFFLLRFDQLCSKIIAIPFYRNFTLLLRKKILQLTNSLYKFFNVSTKEQSLNWLKQMLNGLIHLYLGFLFYLKARPFTLSPELARQVLQVHRAEKEFDDFHNEVKTHFEIVVKFSYT